MVVGIWAPCNASNENDSKDEYTRLEKTHNPNRRRSPAKDYLEVIYDGNGFTFVPYYITSETFSVSITSSNNSFYAVIDMESDYYVATGSLNGDVSISCTSESGITYSGCMYIE